MNATVTARARGEWPTWCALFGCYSGWILATWFHEALGPWFFVIITVPLVTFHSSLQHEALHGHPTRSRAGNEATIYPSLGIFVPFRRFRDLHLRHHKDVHLTDPYDDPESWYLYEIDWSALSLPMRLLLQANGTLAGRLVFGPALSIYALWRGDLRLARAGDLGIRQAYLHHLLGLAPVVLWIWAVCGIHPVFYVAAVAYPAYSLLMIRTFAEHRAAEAVPERTAIIEASPPLALLFLNNNLHAAHHEQPALPWYRLPVFYRKNRERLLRRNGGYAYKGYGQVFLKFFFRRREPVPHPFFRRDID